MTSAGSVYVPTPVRRKAEATGAAGIHWLRDLSMVVADLEEEWQIEVGETIPGGSGGFVAAASTADGVRVVLKIAIPDGLEGQGDFAREVATLQYGNPASYVRLVRVDHSRRAVLLERLGRPLSELGWSVESQIDVIAETLRRSWKRIAPGVVDRTGAQQAEFLAKFIDRQWFELGEPCARATIDGARRALENRHEAFDPRTAVLIHGDAHPANVLEDPLAPGPAPRFKLIDPDGMISEPAHDLAIPLRDWTAELLAGDPIVPARAWCVQLGAAAAVDATAIWEWAFAERVSTGLFLLSLGDQRGRQFLRVADAWASAGPTASAAG